MTGRVGESHTENAAIALANAIELYKNAFNSVQ
jgi:hypothetical protein